MRSEKSLASHLVACRLAVAIFKLAVAGCNIDRRARIACGIGWRPPGRCCALEDVGDGLHHPHQGLGLGNPDGWQTSGSTNLSHTTMAVTGTGANYGMDLGISGFYSSFGKRKSGVSGPAGGFGGYGSAGGSKGDESAGPMHGFVTSSNYSGFGQWSGKTDWSYLTNYQDRNWRKYSSNDSANCNPPPSRYPPPTCHPPGGSGDPGDDGHHHDHDDYHHYGYDPGGDDGHHHHHHHHYYHHTTPEPGSMTLWGIGTFGLLGWSLRSRKPNGYRS